MNENGKRIRKWLSGFDATVSSPQQSALSCEGTVTGSVLRFPEGPASFSVVRGFPGCEAFALSAPCWPESPPGTAAGPPQRAPLPVKVSPFQRLGRVDTLLTLLSSDPI